MYSKCGLINSARLIFNKMPQRSIVSWNTMISLLTQHGLEGEAWALFKMILTEGTLPTKFTLSSILCTCASKSAACESKQLQAFALKTAMDSNVFVGTALLDVYAKCSMIKDALKVFHCMPDKSAVTWSSIIAGCVQNNLFEYALLFIL
ncbi:hypothetical protein MKX01_032904 [Papaver californicum]|nr:hypothetical protein MKX01_032904 [Papaver californicum]